MCMKIGWITKTKDLNKNINYLLIMMEEITISPNWEISIPIKMCKSLNIKEGDEILIIRKDDEIILKKLI